MEMIAPLPGMDGRCSIPALISTDKLVILDDCYNANPVSMKASMDVLDLAIGRKVAVLGDMGELGEDASRMHYETGAYASKKELILYVQSAHWEKRLPPELPTAVSKKSYGSRQRQTSLPQQVNS